MSTRIDNTTRFAACTYVSRDAGSVDFQVVVVRGTFDIERERLTVAARQPPPATTAVFSGAPFASSLLRDHDMAPFKPATDVTLRGTAHAPGGVASPSWDVSLRVGMVHKRLTVTGERSWRRAGRGRWRLTEPRPTVQVPLVYELASTGARGDEARLTNPVGRRPIGKDETGAEVPAPRIVHRDDEPPRAERPARVEGFGALAASWSPRCGRTSDPAHGAFEFFNTAHPDLVADGYLVGDEEVVLDQIGGDGVTRFLLPGIAVSADVTDRTGHRVGSLARLDTVHIDTDERTLTLVWRATIPHCGEDATLVTVHAREAPRGAPYRRVRVPEPSRRSHDASTTALRAAAGDTGTLDDEVRKLRVLMTNIETHTEEVSHAQLLLHTSRLRAPFRPLVPPPWDWWMNNRHYGELIRDVLVSFLHWVPRRRAELSDEQLRREIDELKVELGRELRAMVLTRARVRTLATRPERQPPRRDADPSHELHR